METADNTGELWIAHINRQDEIDGKGLTPEMAARELGIYTKRRPTEISLKRFLFWYFVRRQNPRITFDEIGRMTGGQNHSTVYKGIEYVKDPFNRKEYLNKYEEEVFKVICKTDFSDVRKKGQSLQKRKD